MPPLPNARHEKFVQGLFAGKPASTAYEEAGYSFNEGNAVRLKGNERVQARLAELQAEVAKKTTVTVESLIDELEHARIRADGLDQLSAAVKAISEKAKISGLLVQKVEVGAPGSFEKCETTAEIARELAKSYLFDLPGGNFREISERDCQGLADLMERYLGETEAYLKAIQAKPIVSGKSVLHTNGSKGHGV